jgi:hypothetical protein
VDRRAGSVSDGSFAVEEVLDDGVERSRVLQNGKCELATSAPKTCRLASGICSAM